MNSLKNILNESLKFIYEDNFDNIKIKIIEFLNKNYRLSSKNAIDITQENDIYIVNSKSDVRVISSDISSLTDNLFEWGEVDGDFECAYCNKLKSLKGAPKWIGGDFSCTDCNSLISLEGSPEEVEGSFNCAYCDNLISLKGSPEYINKNFECYECYKLASLKGAPKRVGGNFECKRCAIKNLKGAPIYIDGNFDCRENTNLKSLDGIGKVKGKIYSDLN